MAKIYPPEIKAQVIAEYEMGGAQATLARKHKIPRSTVRLWTQGAPVPPVADRFKRETLGELVAEYLDTGLRAAIAFHRRLADPSYLSRTEPADQRSDYATLMDRWFGMARGLSRDEADDVRQLTDGVHTP